MAVVYTLRTYILKPMFFYYPRRLKALNFDNYDISHNSFLWPEYFIDFLCERWIPCPDFDIRLVFTLPPRDSTLQYKRCVHLWNNFPWIRTLGLLFNNLKLHFLFYLRQIYQQKKYEREKAKKSCLKLVKFWSKVAAWKDKIVPKIFVQFYNLLLSKNFTVC